MSQYTKSTNFATKDNLTPGDPLKIVRGTEIDTEFNNIATAIATKTDNASADLTGGTINDTTIGATTASTGAFTTLAASGNVTLSGGTANGVAYLNGSKIVTSGSALTFDGTNLTNQQSVNSPIGINLDNISASTSAGTRITFKYNGTQTGYVANQFDGSDFNNQYAANRFHIWSNNGTEQMRLTSTGLGIGTSSPAALLNLSSGSGTKAIWGTTRNIGGVNRNWQIAVDEYAEGQFTITPSTTLGGTTFTTPSIRLDTSGNLGLGVTPSAWGIGKALQVNNASMMGYLNRLYASANTYFDGTGTGKYIATDYATSYQQLNGQHQWFTAASGTAGNAITFTQALTLGSDGNLLVGGTSSLGYRSQIFASTNGYTQALVQTGAYNSGNLAGTVYSGYYDGSSITDMASIRGGKENTTSGNYGGMLAFYTRANGGSDTERARIDSSGAFLVGQTTPYYSEKIGAYSSSSYCYSSIRSGTGSEGHMVFTNANGAVGSIFTNGSSTSFNTSSDYRLKNITGNLTGYKERLMSLQPKQGTWIVDGSEFRGFLAHDFAGPYRASVSGEKDAVDADGKPIMQSMQASSSEVMADLVALVQEQQAIIESLKARLDAANL